MRLAQEPILHFPSYKASVVKIYNATDFFYKGCPGWERTRDLLISFIFSFHHFTAEPQRLPTTQLIAWRVFRIKLFFSNEKTL
jgi:hypothetical protein